MMILTGLMVVVAIAVAIYEIQSKSAQAEALEPVLIPVRVDETNRELYRGGRRF